MGLTDLSIEDFEKLKDLVKLLNVFGIEEEDLRYLHEALEIVKNKKFNNTNTLTSEEIKKIKEENKKNFESKFTPQDFLNTFKQTNEEFYPYGKEKDKGNSKK